MANATKGRSKKRKSAPKKQNAAQLTPSELKKAQRKIQRKVQEPSPFASMWLIVPAVVALVCSPALAIFTASVGALLVLVGACLQKQDKMRGKLLAAGVGAIAGSLPWIIYLVLKALDIVGQ